MEVVTVSLHSFSSVEEMLAAIEHDRVEADRDVRSWQVTLQPGDFFVRVGPGNVAIYCEVLDPALPQEAGPHSQEYLDELKEGAAWYSEPHMKNFRFCRAFSVYCPNGELGDVHISTSARPLFRSRRKTSKTLVATRGILGTELVSLCKSLT